MKVAIIGGGAAGFFSAISVKENYPDAKVVIFEKSQKLLSKVKISGGGRCNVTNGCDSIDELVRAYPRGSRFLKKAFHVFNTKHTIEWFRLRGVPLVIQEDNCVFPVSQNSQSIIDCFLDETKRLGIKIETGKCVDAIKKVNDYLKIEFSDDENRPALFDKVIVAAGGSAKRGGLEWLEALDHKIEDPVPSLFSFNMPGEAITQLMGIAVEKTFVNIQGTKIKSDGALLITHWGMSGPAILKLSSFGARILSEKEYNFKIQVNWVYEHNHGKVMNHIDVIVKNHSDKLLSSFRPYALPERLWLFLLQKCDLPAGRRWAEFSKKGIQKLVSVLTNDVYAVKGKSKFKDEFVTCGGVSLPNIDPATMQSKVCKNLYFAGEILDIDAITGGYNFQAAWTTGFLAGQLR